MIEILILYLLNRHDLTIYKLHATIEELFFPFQKPSLGSIAPILNKLGEKKFVSFVEKFSKGGLKSKTFSITPLGLSNLKKMLLEFEFKGLYNTMKNSKTLLMCIDILDENEKNKLLCEIENNLKILNSAILRQLQNPYVMLFDFQTALLQNEQNEVLNLINIVGRKWKN